MNRKIYLLLILPMVLTCAISACAPASIIESDDAELFIKDFLSSEDIYGILGIKPKGYNDYNHESNHAWAYYDFDDETDSMGLCLHVYIYKDDAIDIFTPYPLVEDGEASRNEFEEITILGQKEKLRITYHTDYIGEGFENKVERNSELMLAFKRDNIVYLFRFYGPDHINYKQQLLELMEKFVHNVEAGIDIY